jgi:hypothetical protein
MMATEWRRFFGGAPRVRAQSERERARTERQQFFDGAPGCARRAKAREFS